MYLDKVEKILAERIASVATEEDPAHDFLHFKRVVEMAKKLAVIEGAKMEVVVPAAWLHDFVIIPKNDPRRKLASQLSAEKAIAFLKELNYPEIYFSEISNAIAAHSFSANIVALSKEAEIVQDADRLDGLGAIGIARCFATAGIMKRAFYSADDPFCTQRPPDDSQFTVDHFYAKLYKTVETLKTEAGRREGQKRLAVMRQFLLNLGQEI